MINFKDVELKEQVRMFDDYCKTYEISDQDWNTKCKDILQAKLYPLLIEKSQWTKENVKSVIYESISETCAWEKEEDSFEKYLKDKGLV